MNSFERWTRDQNEPDKQTISEPISRVGELILSSFGSPGSIEHHLAVPWYCRFTPRNEIKALVYEFRKMISQFSGGGTAKLFKRQLFEVKNPFLLEDQFKTLYKESRACPETVLESNRRVLGSSMAGYPRRRSSGTNCLCAGTILPDISDMYARSSSVFAVAREERQGIVKSQLFHWLLGMITLPLLLTFVFVASFVS